MAIQRINLTAGSGGSDFTVYTQALANAINDDSVNWAWRMLEKIGRLGEAIDDIMGSNNETLRGLPNFTEIITSYDGMSVVANYATAMNHIANNQKMLNIIGNSLEAKEALSDNYGDGTSAYSALYNSSLAREIGSVPVATVNTPIVTGRVIVVRARGAIAARLPLYITGANPYPIEGITEPAGPSGSITVYRTAAITNPVARLSSGTGTTNVSVHYIPLTDE